MIITIIPNINNVIYNQNQKNKMIRRTSHDYTLMMTSSRKDFPRVPESQSTISKQQRPSRRLDLNSPEGRSRKGSQRQSFNDVELLTSAPRVM